MCSVTNVSIQRPILSQPVQLVWNGMKNSAWKNGQGTRANAWNRLILSLPLGQRSNSIGTYSYSIQNKHTKKPRGQLNGLHTRRLALQEWIKPGSKRALKNAREWGSSHDRTASFVLAKLNNFKFPQYYLQIHTTWELSLYNRSSRKKGFSLVFNQLYL